MHANNRRKKMQIRDLALAASAAGIKDVRFYLNSVLITRNFVLGSGGYKLVRVMRDDDQSLPDELEQIIIPIETVKSFLKKFGKKDELNSFEVIKIGDQYALQSGCTIEVFEPIDHAYPDFKKAFQKIIEEQGQKESLTDYDYEILGGAQKAINTFLSRKGGPVKFVRRDTLGYFQPTNDVIYIVMPCRV